MTKLLQVLIQYMEQYLSIEEIFSSNARLEDTMLTLRQTFIGNLNECVAYSFSHANLEAKNELMFRIMDKIVDLKLHSYHRTREVLLRVAGLDKMQLPGYSKLSQRAKSVIVHEDEKNQDAHKTSNTQGSPNALQRMDSLQMEDVRFLFKKIKRENVTSCIISSSIASASIEKHITFTMDFLYSFFWFMNVLTIS